MVSFNQEFDVSGVDLIIVKKIWGVADDKLIIGYNTISFRVLTKKVHI